MEGNINRKKRSKSKFTIFDLIVVLVIIGILIAILVPSFKKYSNDLKKVEVKSIVREYVMAVETAQIIDKIEFSNTDSIKTIESDNGDKLTLLNKYINNLEDLNKIKDLTIEDAKQIINNEVDFEVDKQGKFVRVIKKK